MRQIRNNLLGNRNQRLLWLQTAPAPQCHCTTVRLDLQLLQERLALPQKALENYGFVVGNANIYGSTKSSQKRQNQGGTSDLEAQLDPSQQRLAGFAEQLGPLEFLGNGVKEKCLDEALQAAECMGMEGVQISREIIYCLLLECNKRKDLAAGRRVHALMVKNGLDSNAFLGDHLIRVFASCGSLEEVNEAFHKVSKPTVYTWNAIISAHDKLGEGEKALELFCEMQACGVEPDKCTLFCSLKACGRIGAVGQGRLLHHLIIEGGHESKMAITNTLVDMYAKCGSMDEAHKVFDGMPARDVVSWAAIISGCAQYGHVFAALKLYIRLQQEAVQPNDATYLGMLKACGSIGAICHGRIIHDHINRSSLELDVNIGNSLIDMYGKCGSIEEAKKIFNMWPNRDVVLWGSMIEQYAESGDGFCALDLFDKMQQEGKRPNKVIFLSVLKACGLLGSLKLGRLIHNLFIQRKMHMDVVVGSSLVDMYCKCGSVEEAHQVFNDVQEKNVVLWGAIIAGYTQHGHSQLAFKAFEEMQEGIKPNKVIFLCILKACGKVGAVQQGRLVHEQINRSGLLSDVAVKAALIEMYTKCQCLTEARKVFDESGSEDAVMWGAMITGYAEHGHNLLALELFKKMQQDGVGLDKATLLSILKACGSMGMVEQGRQVHRLVVKLGLGEDLTIGNTLVDMYAKCGSLQEAQCTFTDLHSQDVVSWGILITGYAQHGDGLLAFEAFKKMQELHIKPDKVTFLGVLKACVSLQACRGGMLVHEYIIRNGDLASDTIVGSTLVDMYAKGESLHDARKVFDDLPNRDVVLCSQMISAYIEHGHGLLALEIFQKMQQEGLNADKVAFLCVLKACGSIGAVGQGRLLHDQIIKNGLISDLTVASSLLDMYAKCGSLEESRIVFSGLQSQDAVSWGVIINGHAQYGNCSRAQQCLESMQHVGVKPNQVTYTSVLNAYSHAGQLEQGHKHLNSSIEDLITTPCIEQYSCMVDLFGRTGHFNEAEDLVCTMPITPNSTVWVSLLTSCRTHGKVELGKRCFDVLSQLQPDGASGYVLLSNIYADTHKWKNVDDLQKLKRFVYAQKKPGIAWVEVKDKVHEFIVGDNKYLDEFDMKVKRLNQLFKREGYVPKLDLVLESPAIESTVASLVHAAQEIVTAVG